jgi:hypothetical protein
MRLVAARNGIGRPHNDEMQLTSGGSARASRAHFIKRRLQLISVLGGLKAIASMSPGLDAPPLASNSRSFNMKRIIRSLLVPCLFCSLVSGAAMGNAQEAAPRPPRSIGEPAEIKLIAKMEEDRVQAGVRKDVEAIAAATADEYLQIDFNGDIRDKSAAMQRIKSSAFLLEGPQKALSTARTLASRCGTAACM